MTLPVDTIERLSTDIGQHDRWMPIQIGSQLDLRVRRGERLVIVRRIPWELIAGESCERQSQTNHQQSLERIADRGGFSACEALCVIAGVAWQPIDDVLAHRLLYSLHVSFNRGRQRDVKFLRTIVAASEGQK